MNRRWIRRAAVAITLAATLALAAPAGASGWPAWAPRSDVFHALRQWIVALWSAPAGESGAARNGAAQLKEGSGIDPSGSPGHPTTPVSQTNGNVSGGLNPSGW